ncbi:MAG: hypothetical protein MUF87_16195 [Anaerolineae bacterium]|jgi:hypothetical protein|nr:hypothetical protein [Anaerolineae bacterium]
MDYEGEKPKRTYAEDSRANLCLFCGGDEYEWGHPGSQGGVYFLPQGAIFGFGLGEALDARKCLGCGNVQLFTKSQ